VNNLNDGMAWGLFPLFFSAAHDLGQIGTLAAIYPATWGVSQLVTGACPTASAASGSSRRACGSRPWASACRPGRAASRASPPAPRCSGWAPRWCTRRCSRPSATWRTPRGARRRWASTGSGATSATRSARCSRASPPTRFGLPAAMWPSRRSRSRRVSWSPCGCARRSRPLPVRHAVEPTCVEPGARSVERRGRRRALAGGVRGGHVAGAINIPLDALAAGSAELPRDAVVVTACGKGGGRSDRAADQLRALGFTSARSLCGGTQAWMQLTAQGT
jgi:hypothetical protein